MPFAKVAASDLWAPQVATCTLSPQEGPLRNEPKVSTEALGQEDSKSQGADAEVRHHPHPGPGERSQQEGRPAGKGVAIGPRWSPQRSLVAVSDSADRPELCGDAAVAAGEPRLEECAFGLPTFFLTALFS